jgi:hypothetical protein
MAAKVIPFDREAAIRRTLHTSSKPLNLRKNATSRETAGNRPPKKWFVRGPFPGEQFEIAARLSGKALVVWELVHHQCHLRRKAEVTLSTILLERVGVGPDAKVRALRYLEKAGLITVTWQAGRAPRIALVRP